MVEGPAGFPRVTSLGPFTDVEAEQEFIIEDVGTEKPGLGIAQKLNRVGFISAVRFNRVEARLIVREEIPETESGILERINKEVDIATRDTSVANGSYVYSGDTAIVKKIEVGEGFRGIGVGTELKERMLHDMSRRGIIHVFTLIASEEGRALAETTGFTNEGPHVSDDSSIYYRNIENL